MSKEDEAQEVEDIVVNRFTESIRGLAKAIENAGSLGVNWDDPDVAVAAVTFGINPIVELANGQRTIANAITGLTEEVAALRRVLQGVDSENYPMPSPQTAAVQAIAKAIQDLIEKQFHTVR